MERARSYAREAFAAMRDFPDNEARRALLWVPEFVLARNS
jgi:geranylgeranyl pyrophosphate synthase